MSSTLTIRRTKARRDRRNARSHDEVVVSFGDILNYREFDDDAVAKINYVIKTWAVQYVASLNKSDLHPEQAVDIPRWSEIDELFYSEYGSWR
jgi:hypothetical protein